MSAIQEFGSIGEFLKKIEEDLDSLKKIMGTFIRRLEEARVKAENEKKLAEIFSKFGQEVKIEVKPIEIHGTKIYVNPPAGIEYSVLESVIDKLNRRVQALQALHKGLEPLLSIGGGVRVTVIYEEGIPKTIILRY